MFSKNWENGIQRYKAFFFVGFIPPPPPQKKMYIYIYIQYIYTVYIYIYHSLHFGYDAPASLVSSDIWAHCERPTKLRCLGSDVSSKKFPPNKLLTLPETNSSPLKMAGWNTILSYWVSAYFQVRFGSVYREGKLWVKRPWAPKWCHQQACRISRSK